MERRETSTWGRCCARLVGLLDCFEGVLEELVVVGIVGQNVQLELRRSRPGHEVAEGLSHDAVRYFLDVAIFVELAREADLQSKSAEFR